jgi:hypothetical protein
MKQPIQIETEVEAGLPVELNISFILDNTKIINQERDKTEIHLFGTHVHILSLLKNINYSTNKELETGQISPYKIITDLMNKISFDFDINYIDTDTAIHFISSKTMNVKDMIDYCLIMRSIRKNIAIIFYDTYIRLNSECSLIKKVYLNYYKIE